MAIQKPSHTFTKIHLKALRTNIHQILFILSFTVFINTLSFAQDLPKEQPNILPKTEKEKTLNDTLTVAVDSILKSPNIARVQDSTSKDSIPKKKSLLEGMVTYKAKDYVSTNVKAQKIYLYNEAKVTYKDLEITAGTIVIDYAKNEIYAGRIKDSSGNYTQLPVFTQGNTVVEPDSIRFNTDTKRALVWNSRTEQSGGTIIAERSKKENDSVYYISNSKFTTSENLDDPEYYFLIRKGKIVPDKKVVTGYTNMYIYDVWTPIMVPFAYFPLSKKRSSGIIIPSFGEDTGNDRGYFLQNGGYYFALSDYYDLTVLGDYYTNGSYGLRMESAYRKRYKFSGNFSFRYENLINEERGFPDYSKSTIYNIRWTHSKDAKSNPNSRFSASVNLGSSRYYQQSINQLNLPNTLNNNLSSSISYSKTFQGEPQVNLSLAATHSQNSNTEAINMTLPTLQANMSRIYPFAPKIGTKKGIIQNINFQYSLRGENRFQTADSIFFKKEMFDNGKMGVQHSIPISTNFKILKYLSISASTNFQESWVFNTIEKSYDQDTEETIVTDIKGFDSFRSYNFNTALGTTLYGMYTFGENKKIQAIRHVMRPNISYNISPAFDQYYDTYDEVIDADGTTSVEYSRFEESLYTAPSSSYSSAIGIGLNNTIEAKIRDNDNEDGEAKKVPLFSSLNFSTSYNLAADSLKLSPIRMTGGTSLFQNKLSLNFGATMDAYALNNSNQRINKLNINNGGSLLRLTSANATLGYSISSKDFKESASDAAAQEESLRSGGRIDGLFGKSEDFADQRLNQNDEEKDVGTSELYNYSIPWNVRFAYALNYSNSTRQNEISSHSLMFSGDIDISPRWSVGASSGYDLKNKAFTLTQFRFERDLLSWRMNFSWVPFGDYARWNFFIGIRSSLLKDLKYDKRKQSDKEL
ncbi:MAG: LPS-assembly protein LptD [Flavobacteriaceae bacterium]|nr:LPS-assembly protein LptD [Flavobacteriaceae bacterium]